MVLEEPDIGEGLYVAAATGTEGDNKVRIARLVSRWRIVRRRRASYQDDDATGLFEYRTDCIGNIDE